MTNEEYRKIMEEIETLPPGGITYKRINGKEYAYYQWRQDGKQRSRRAKDEELDILSIQIERRKYLQNLIKYMDISLENKEKTTSQFHCLVRVGGDLERFVKPVEKWIKRNCYQQLHNYVYGDIHEK